MRVGRHTDQFKPAVVESAAGEPAGDAAALRPAVGAVPLKRQYHSVGDHFVLFSVHDLDAVGKPFELQEDALAKACLSGVRSTGGNGEGGDRLGQGPLQGMARDPGLLPAIFVTAE